VLTEGEFDALSIAQECGNLVAVVATGTTKGSHTPRWISVLAQQGRVFVAFDAERDKGDVDAQWWTRRLGNAQRLRPLWNDANQMLQDGVNLREWISAAIAKAAGSRVMSLEEQHEGPIQERPNRLSQQVCTTALSSWARPQARCPFEQTIVDRTRFIKWVPCQGKPLVERSGWCAEHQQAQTLLDIGAQLGYPRIQVTRQRAIGAGRGSWEAYACRAPAGWLCHDLPIIRSQCLDGACWTPVESDATVQANAHGRVEETSGSWRVADRGSRSRSPLQNDFRHCQRAKF
jgi:Toprim-like